MRRARTKRRAIAPLQRPEYPTTTPVVQALEYWWTYDEDLPEPPYEEMEAVDEFASRLGDQPGLHSRMWRYPAVHDLVDMYTESGGRLSREEAAQQIMDIVMDTLDYGYERNAGVILGNGVYRYAQKTFDDRYLNSDGVDFYIYALVVAKKKPKLDGFKQVGKKAPLPPEISRDLSEEQKDYAKEHQAKGHLWFFKLEGEGWDWTSAGGAKGAAKVQDALNYLKRFKKKDRVGGVEAVYIEINSTKRGKKEASVRTAGWWGDAPMDGDTPLDMVAALEEVESPGQGALILQEWLSGNYANGKKAFDPAGHMYGALGVWDYVVTTGPDEWRDAFLQLAPRIPKVAQEVIRRTEDEEGSVFGGRYLREYAKGNIASQTLKKTLYGEPFFPGKRTWYINDAYVDYFGTDEISVRIEVRQKGSPQSEYEILDETIPGPEGASVQSAEIENYGGEDSSQQSAVLKIYYETEDDYGESDAQIDVNLETGEIEDITINWDY